MNSFNHIDDNKAFDYESILENEKPTDVVLVAGGKRIHAHKVELSARSPAFAAMFGHDTKEAQENRVEIIDVDVEVLKRMLGYIYTDKVEALDRYAPDLLIAADKYQVDSLKSICEERLLRQFSIESVSDLLIFADQFSITELFNY